MKKQNYKNKSRLKLTLDALNKLYNLRYNEIIGQVEYKKHSDKDFKIMDDYQINTILNTLELSGHCTTKVLLYQILESDFIKKFNPFTYYLTSIKDLEIGRDYIQELADTVYTTNNEFWNWSFRKWFVAMVASLIDEKVINHTVLVFNGPQGIGKTTWIEKLIPEKLKNYKYSGMINPNNKDTLIKLACCMLINMDELENLNKTKIGTLKEIITKPSISIRKAYGRHNINLPRYASFAGSVNQEQFLNDTTGSRRFLCNEVTRIDYQHEVSIDKAFAQALKLYKEGFQYWFDGGDIYKVNAKNEKHQIRTLSEEALLKHFSKPCFSDYLSRKSKIRYYTTTTILGIINDSRKVSVNHVNVISLGRALNKHGFKRVSKNNQYVWAVISNDSDTIHKEEKKL